MHMLKRLLIQPLQPDPLWKEAPAQILSEAYLQVHLQQQDLCLALQ